MPLFDLMIFDMAGTTVRDRNEVEDCFLKACKESGVKVTSEQVLGMMGWSKKLVFETLLKEQLGEGHAEYARRVNESYDTFKFILETHYENKPVEPAEGAMDCFDWLYKAGIPIVLTTGFYRKVTNIILRKLNWHHGLDERYIGNSKSLIQASITSDEVSKGRPAPYMIQRAMAITGVENVSRVVNIGDTPSDLLSGRNAGCGLNLGVTNGTHTEAQLKRYPNDALLASLHDLKRTVESHFGK